MLTAHRSPLAARRSPMVDGRWSMVGFSLPKCPVGNNFAGSPDLPAKKVFLCGVLDADYPMGYYDNNTGEKDDEHCRT